MARVLRVYLFLDIFKELVSNGRLLGYCDARDELLWIPSLLSNFFDKGPHLVFQPHDNIARFSFFFIFILSASEIYVITPCGQLVTFRGLLNN